MNQTMVLADVLVPRRGLLREITLIVTGTLLITASAQVRIPLPFTPVPITGQTFAVLLVGAGLGATRGVLSVLLYLTQGALGWPVFAGGTGGIMHLLGPTGGYLVGFLAAAWLTGHLAERGWDRHLSRATLAMALGNLVIYALGVLWLARFVGWPAAFWQGALPFLPGDALKIALAAAVLPSMWRLVGTWTSH